jgi:hypothetical protein
MGTDQEGRLRLQGFLGEYEVSAAGASTTFGSTSPAR